MWLNLCVAAVIADFRSGVRGQAPTGSASGCARRSSTARRRIGFGVRGPFSPSAGSAVRGPMARRKRRVSVGIGAEPESGSEDRGVEPVHGGESRDAPGRLAGHRSIWAVARREASKDRESAYGTMAVTSAAAGRSSATSTAPRCMLRPGQKPVPARFTSRPECEPQRLWHRRGQQARARPGRPRCGAANGTARQPDSECSILWIPNGGDFRLLGASKRWSG